MQVTDEVRWTAFDFAFATGLILAVGLPLDWILRRTVSLAVRAGAALALGTGFLLVWANGAVGLIGSENEAVNLLYYVVLAIGLAGAAAARFRPRGTATALVATAVAQGAVAAGALVGGWGAPENGPIEVVAVNAVFVLLWLTAAALLAQAPRDAATAG